MKNELSGRGSLTDVPTAIDLRTSRDEGLGPRVDTRREGRQLWRPDLVGGKSIDNGVGGHEAAWRTRPGFRGFRPALGGGVLVAALPAVFAAVLVSSPPADARVAVDPCLSPEPQPPPGERRSCGDIYEVNSLQKRTLPVDGRQRSLWCKQSEKLAGTGQGIFEKDLIAAHWDFWSYDGAWTTWTGLGETHFHDDNYISAYSPEIFNWWGQGSWPVRAFMYCDAKPTTRQRASSALSGRTHTDETVEPGDSGDDAIEGGDEDDVLIGEGGDDELQGASGDDEFAGGPGDDATQGGRGDDYQLGGSGDDAARGGSGDDQLLGGTGEDEAASGRGSDELFDNEGRDKLHGGKGDDRFSTRDRSADTIRCGRGEDIVVSDRRDRVSADCEHVYRTIDDVPNRPPKT